MAYVKIDDGFYDHPRVIGVPLQALGLWVKGLSYVRKHLTDGHITDQQLSVLAPRKAAVRAVKGLIESGLWDRTETGYVFHDFLDHNDSKEEILEARRKDRDRKAKGKKGQFPPESNGRPTGGQAEARRIPLATPTLPSPPQLEPRTPTASDSRPREAPAADRPSGHQAGEPGPKNRQPHPREQGYSHGILNDDGQAILEAIESHDPLSPIPDKVGLANLLSGKLGIQGTNKLTVARCKIMLAKISSEAEAMAAGGSRRTGDELLKHLASWYGKPDAWWKSVEKKQADAEIDDEEPNSPPYHQIWVDPNKDVVKATKEEVQEILAKSEWYQNNVARRAKPKSEAKPRPPAPPSQGPCDLCGGDHSTTTKEDCALYAVAARKKRQMGVGPQDASSLGDILPKFDRPEETKTDG